MVDRLSFIIDGSLANGEKREGDDLPRDPNSIPPDWSLDEDRAATIKTLGQFLSRYTDGTGVAGTRANRFPIAPDSEVVSSRDPYGNPSGPTPIPNAQSAFASQLTEGRELGPELAPPFRHGFEGHDLYNNVGERTRLGNAISAVLSNNRFTPDETTPFVPAGSDGEYVDSRLFAGEGQELGVHESLGALYSYEDIKNVGASLLLRAAGEFFDGDPDELALAAASTIIPSPVQLGAVKVDANRLTGLRAHGAPAKSGLESDLVGDERPSYGTLNTHLTPFAGFLPAGMAALAVSLVVSLRITLESIFGISQVIAGIGPNQQTLSPTGILGSYGKRDAASSFTSIRKLMGFVQTENHFLTAVDKGIDVLFSGQTGSSIGFSGDAMINVLESPGFYATMCRAIIRGGSDLVEDIGDTASNVPTNPIQASLGLIDVFRQSRLVSFINILAAIGDRAIEAEKHRSGADGRVSLIDALPVNGQTRQSKNRVKASRRLAWEGRAARSLLMLPDSIRKAYAVQGGRSSNELDASALEFVSTPGSRLPRDRVDEMENLLDAEYVPFYFHDLRTNEIVAFHAFLTQLTDAYNVTYSSTQAYGRVDQVRKYGSTERSINVAFYVVATNEQDFDAMWWKINKLVTLVYPQWSKGRSVLNQENGTRFTQPFSQLISSTPVIRMRLGDLFSTNGSKFALMRLFGAGSGDFSVHGRLTDAEPDEDESSRFSSQNRQRLERDPAMTGASGDGYAVGDVARLRPGSYKARRDELALVAFLNSSVPDFSNVSSDTLIEIVGRRIVDVPADPGARYTEYTFILRDAIGGNQLYFARHEDLIPDEEQLVGQLADLLPTPATRHEQPGRDFFSSNENAVVRAFESTSGKGLAGVIDSLDFDWMDGNRIMWETARHGSRAPKMCIVRIRFMPIHDVPPGIDHSGFDRAPVYPVGSISRFVGRGGEADPGRDAYYEAAREADLSPSESPFQVPDLPDIGF